MTACTEQGITEMRDERLKKNLSAGGRESRAVQDGRQSADESLASSRERRRMFRDEWIQESLPKPPGIPGFHLCWLSSTNGYDPIHKRLRMGYTPVKPEEVPAIRCGWSDRLRIVPRGCQAWRYRYNRPLIGLVWFSFCGLHRAGWFACGARSLI